MNMALGQHPAIFATGKLRDFPHGGLFIEENICSCGEPATTCPFWIKVRERYLPFQEGADRKRIPQLFQIITDLSTREFVGDVTHNVGYAEQLMRTPGIDLYLVHVVRDGRGVVYSRIRKDYRIGRLDKAGWKHVRRVITVSRRWAWHVKQFGRLERELDTKAVRISYETLCSDPRSALNKVGKCLNLDFTDIGEQLAAGQPFQPIPHLIRGNAVLRTKKDIVLRYDTAYRTAMPPLDLATFRIASKLPIF